MQIFHRTFGNMGNNCYLIVDEDSGRSALVDCPEFSDEMIDFIGDTELQYILLTHGHFDHIGGVADIRQRYGASVVIGELDAPMLTSSRESLAAFVGAEHKDTAADITVSDGDVITLGALTIIVMHTPGHTPGGVCYIVGDALFSGDTLFRCSCGRTDFPGGSSNQMLASLHRLAALDGDYTVYTGHDALSTLDYERKYNPYMTT